MKDKKENLKKLGKTIVKERVSKGYTAEKLAYEMGISKGNLSEIERGLRDARFSTLSAIAEGLGISVSRLLKDL